MSLLFWYGFFSLVTAIMAISEIIHPVIKEEAQTKEVANKYTIYVVFFLVALLTSPLIFLACIFAPINEQFRKGFAKGVFSKD